MTKYILFTMMSILTLDQILMHYDVPRVGQLVGVGVTVTVTVVIIVMCSGDAVSTRNKEQLSHEALATYFNMKEQIKQWSLADFYASVTLESG